MSSEWVEIHLGDFIELKRGYDLPRKQRTKGSVPLVSSAGVSDHHSEAKVSGPGVVTGRYGTIGEVFYIDSDFWPLNTTLYVRDFKGNDPRFTYYFLKTIDYKQYSDKAAVPGINRNHLHKAKISVPECVEEQRRIASVLSSLDDKIDVNHQIHQTLEQIAQAIFKSWFVDFDPVKAKVAAGQRWRALQPVPEPASPVCYADDEVSLPDLETYMNLAAMQAISGKDEEQLAQMQAEQPEQYAELLATAALFPSAMQEGELGEIPEGWEICSAQSKYQITIGKTPPRKETEWFSGSPENVKWLSIKKMGDGNVFANDSDEYLTSEAIRKHNIKLCPTGTVLLSFKLTLGRVAIANTEMTTNEAIAHFRIGAESPGTYWTYLCLSAFDYDALGSTSSIATAVNSKTIKGMPLVVPGEPVLRGFEAAVKPLFEAIRNSQSNSDSLMSARDILLPKFMSGELTLPNIEELQDKLREEVYV